MSYNSESKNKLIQKDVASYIHRIPKGKLYTKALRDATKVQHSMLIKIRLRFTINKHVTGFKSVKNKLYECKMERILRESINLRVLQTEVKLF